MARNIRGPREETCVVYLKYNTALSNSLLNICFYSQPFLLLLSNRQWLIQRHFTTQSDKSKQKVCAKPSVWQLYQFFPLQDSGNIGKSQKNARAGIQSSGRNAGQGCVLHMTFLLHIGTHSTCDYPQEICAWSNGLKSLAYVWCGVSPKWGYYWQ